MGILQFKDLTDWQDAAANEEHALAADPDDAGPIGARQPTPVDHTATWIHADPGHKDDLIYGDEVKVEVYRGQDKLLPKDLQEKMGIRELRGWLFQVRKSGPNPQPEAFARLDGKEVLLSKLPHSRNYFVRRTLKPCKHEQGDVMWRRIARAWDNYPEIHFADERLDRALQELSVTPFVTHKGCSAAWAVMANRFTVLGEERFDTKDDYTVAALEMPFAEACGRLMDHPAILNALDLTESGTLFNNYRLKRDVDAAVYYKMDAGKGPVQPFVSQELFENRQRLVEAACWAALCGREVRDAGDSVARSAVLLYHRFAFNFVGREKNPIRRAPQMQASAWQQGIVWPQPDGGLQKPETNEDLTVQWRELGRDAALGKLRLLIAHILQTNEDAIDEDFVSTMRPPLDAWPPGWERPEGFDKALRRLTKFRN